MLQEIETQINVSTDVVMMTPSAAHAVQDILAERKLDGYALRVYVAGGGCCSVQFGMALDNIVRDNDMTFESEGVRVLVDDQSINYLRGAKIDFVNDPTRGAGFLVDSPSAQSGSCSCGSQAHSHAEAGSEGDTCGCGGSCSCGAN
jgi:iron-sulfur cluster assembly accessory protein